MANHLWSQSNIQLNEKTLNKMLQFAEMKTVPAKTVLFTFGDPGTQLFYIFEGRLNATVKSEDREYTLSSIGPKEFVGEIAFFKDHHQRTSELKTLEVCDYAVWNIEKLKNLLKEELIEEAPDFIFLLGHLLALRWLKVSKQASSMALYEAPTRIWMTLLELTRHKDAMTHPKGMQIKVSRQDLAKSVGCSREMAGRIIKQFVKEGRMEARGKAMVIFEDHIPSFRPAA